LVEHAKAFQSDVRLERGEKSASCKSLIAVLKLGLSTESEMRIVAEGVDEDAALESMVSLLDELTSDGAAT